MANKMRPKTIKGYYSVWEKTQAGAIDGQILTGAEMAGLFKFMKTVPISDRYIGDEDQRLIALHGDAFTGDADFIVPPETDDFIYGLFMKKRDSVLPMRATQTEDNLEIRRIEIGDKSFIFEISYFMVDKRNGIVLLINNRNAGSLENFRYYLQGFLAADSDSRKYKLMIGDRIASRLNCAYIPEEDVLSRLAQFSRIGCLHYKLGGEEGRSLRVPGFTSSDDALKAAAEGKTIDDMESLGGFTINVTITPNRGGSLKGSGIKKLFANLSESLCTTKYRKAFNVDGLDKEGRPDALDFVANNIMINTSILYEGKYVSNQAVFEAMEADFLSRRGELADKSRTAVMGG